MGGAAYFSESYDEARRRFRNAAEQRGFTLESAPFDAPPPPPIAPAEEPLALDIALLGPEDAEECLVFSSGLHGVEGYFGAAAQLALILDAELLQALKGRRLVLLHALNPFGMAYDRRCDGAGVDLNRNFLREGEAYTGARPEYEALKDLLNPAAPPSTVDLFALEAMRAGMRHRYRTLKMGLGTGQHVDPEGLWYGGGGPAPLRAALEARLDAWIGSAPRVTWFDLHSGRGHWGAHWLFLNAGLKSARLAELRRRHDPDTLVAVFDGVEAPPAKGLMRDWIAARYAERDAAVIQAEVGSYAPLRVLRELRAENRAWRFAETAEDHARRAARLREAFAPKAPAWRDKAVALALDLARRSLAALET